MKRSGSDNGNGDASVRKALRTVLQSKQLVKGEDTEENAIASLQNKAMPSPSSSNDSSSESHAPSQEEAKLRRERNRQAAQRCRQKRKDRIDELDKEYSKLLEDYKSLEKEVSGLRRQKEDLETLLDTHSCVMDVLKA